MIPSAPRRLPPQRCPPNRLPQPIRSPRPRRQSQPHLSPQLRHLKCLLLLIRLVLRLRSLPWLSPRHLLRTILLAPRPLRLKNQPHLSPLLQHPQKSLLLLLLIPSVHRLLRLRSLP